MSSAPQASISSQASSVVVESFALPMHETTAIFRDHDWDGLGIVVNLAVPPTSLCSSASWAK
jgi:hypothetical protein